MVVAVMFTLLKNLYKLETQASAIPETGSEIIDH